MGLWRYGEYLFPALPDWAKQYAYITLHKPNLGSNYLVATNDIEIQEAYNLTYGTWHDTYAINCVVSNREGSSWGTPVNSSSKWLCGQSPYMDSSLRVRWSSKDLYCAYDDGTTYIIEAAGSAPVDDETGEVITWPPTTPLENDHTAMIQGWIVGKRLAAQRGKRKPEPVAYLYNGVRLPDINSVWTDKETYPYAYICSKTFMELSYTLVLSDTPLCAEKRRVSDHYVVDLMNTVSPVQYATYRIGMGYSYEVNGTEYIKEADTEWIAGEKTGFSNYGDVLFAVDFVWANTNVMLSSVDGNDRDVYTPPPLSDEVYLAASDPIPVYK